MIIIVM